MSKGSWTDDPYGSSDEDFTTLYPISDDRGAAARRPRDFRQFSLRVRIQYRLSVSVWTVRILREYL